MIDCPVCETQNSDEALVCSMCKHVLGRAQTPEEAPLLRAIHTAHPAAARRFRLLMPAGLPLWAAGLWLAAMGNTTPEAPPLLTSGQLSLALWLGGVLLAAGAVGSTVQACGGPFWPGFLCALLPPAIPGVFARATGRPAGANYVYLLSEIIVVYCLLLVFDDQRGSALGTAALGGAVASMPLLIFQFFGGGLGDLARALGLDPWRAVGWLCLGPPALTLVYLAERRLSAGLGLGGVHVWQIATLAYLLATLFIWGRAVHEGLVNSTD